MSVVSVPFPMFILPFITSSVKYFGAFVACLNIASVCSFVRFFIKSLLFIITSSITSNFLVKNPVPVLNLLYLINLSLSFPRSYAML